MQSVWLAEMGLVVWNAGFMALCGQQLWPAGGLLVQLSVVLARAGGRAGVADHDWPAGGQLVPRAGAPADRYCAPWHRGRLFAHHQLSHYPVNTMCYGAEAGVTATISRATFLIIPDASVRGWCGPGGIARNDGMGARNRGNDGHGKGLGVCSGCPRILPVIWWVCQLPVLPA